MIEVYCDNCKDPVESGDDVYCESCWSYMQRDLEDQINSLKSTNRDLESEVIKLYRIIKDLEAISGQ